MPGGSPTDDTPSRYRPLVALLAASTEAEVILTFTAIKRLIGGTLPETALRTAAWWTNPTHRHVRRWRAVGWRAHVDWRNSRVRFTRDVQDG